MKLSAGGPMVTGQRKSMHCRRAPVTTGWTTPVAASKGCGRARAAAKNPARGPRRVRHAQRRRALTAAAALPTVIDQANGLCCGGVGALLPIPVSDAVISWLDGLGLLNVLIWIDTLPIYKSLLFIGVGWYFMLAPPGVLFGIIDFYVFNAIDKLLQRKWSERDFVLGRVRGRGNFGTVYEAFRPNRNDSGASARRGSVSGDRVPDYVLKRVKKDGRGQRIRNDFLTKGTIASGSGETGRAEMYMNGRMRRAMAGVTASYLGNFIVSETGTGFINGEEIIVWKYESDSTLEEYLADPNYPEALELALYGRTRDNDDDSTRAVRVAKDVSRQIFRNLAKFHSVGLVHRDVKPENMLVTDKGRILMIDLGACADLRMGINFNPDEGLLDPDYCPPEMLVVPKSAPRSGFPIFAALGSPLFWLASAPDLFDTYSAGIILLRLLIPTLRNSSFVKSFKAELEKSDDDLRTWRKSGEPQAQNSDFEAADKGLGLAWDLACRLVCPRGIAFRGRLSASAALSHPFLLL